MLEVISPAAVRNILNRYQLACRKSLGQNFLIDRHIADKIVAAADLSPADLAVEIGPGLGALTTRAAGIAGKVLAVEIDRGLLPVLAEVLSGLENTVVVQGDALEIDFDRLVWEQTGGVFGRGGQQYKLLSNLPYYITSPILLRLLHERYNFSLMVIMVQLEVAARLAAAPGSKDYGALSVAVQFYTEVKLLFRVPKTVFFPAPAVDSAVVRLAVRKRPAVPVEDEKTFFRVVRAAFGKRRKTLLNSLATSDLGISKESWKTVLHSCCIDPDRRGETLSLAEFARLTDRLLESKNR
ncbi:MAG: 16S rRNA (adenine(1518)-N(6)/adenine(1519)-N(6))-dimethyltransferase RsmA [Desulfotomaculaceae bacterium]|nr:16S rRNA (adenine(1518)-N(6)/adenine(1519)-N(6))-dimethyltransferase RsmA [Desulfotomaculaceae bacterium]